MSLISAQLQAFLSITKHHTVHAAAKALHLTQTAVTQRLQKLEQQLKISLFVRSRRGMELTTEGEALLRYCQAVEELEGEALAQLQNVGVTAAITVGVTASTSVMRSRVIPRCIAVMQNFPQLLVHYEVDDDEKMRAHLLRTGKAQLAILNPEDLASEMRYKPLKPERYVLVAAKQWQSRSLPDIIQNEKIIDFNPEDRMTFQYLKHYQLDENVRTERHFVNRTDALAELIAAEQGYGVLTKEFSEPYVEAGKLVVLNQNKMYECAAVLAWYDRPAMPKYLRALIDAIN